MCSALYRVLIASDALPTDPEVRKTLPTLFHSLFDIFDADGNGVVDMAELGAGLSVLCGGNADDKIAASFELFGNSARACCCVIASCDACVCACVSACGLCQTLTATGSSPSMR